jgi:hypothetical protein
MFEADGRRVVQSNEIRRRTLCDFAQPRCDDVVHAAAVFAPNARGRRELSCICGMSERQLLKSRGAYLAERVLVAMTPIEIVLCALGPISSHFRPPLHLRREVVVVAPLQSRRRTASVDPPAFAIGRRDANTYLELAPLTMDANTLDVLARLFAAGGCTTVRH